MAGGSKTLNFAASCFEILTQLSDPGHFSDLSNLVRLGSKPLDFRCFEKMCKVFG